MIKWWQAGMRKKGAGHFLKNVLRFGAEDDFNHG